MNVVVAIDSMKGSLSSFEAGNAIKSGILKADPTATVSVCPIADGGEGTTQALIQAMGGRYESVSVCGPIGEPVDAKYGILGDEKTAVLEMAAAAGLPLLRNNQRNPMVTTTRGVGEMILDALEKGCRNFLIGIGGSATNDGGVGMLGVLGYEFFDSDGRNVSDGAVGLESLDRIEIRNALSVLKECTFRIACDVKNPLCGEMGCSAVFAPQKGATSEDVAKMDEWLERYARLTKTVLPEADATAAGAGAAGGLGFAFQSYLNAVLEPGIEIIMDECGLDEKIRKADIVITGEGRLDGQSALGKAPIGVAALAKKYNKPVFAFAGSVTKDARECNENGIDAYFSILQRIVTLETAMEQQIAYENLEDSAEQVFRAICAVR